MNFWALHEKLNPFCDLWKTLFLCFSSPAKSIDAFTEQYWIWGLIQELFTHQSTNRLVSLPYDGVFRRLSLAFAGQQRPPVIGPGQQPPLRGVCWQVLVVAGSEEDVFPGGIGLHTFNGKTHVWFSPRAQHYMWYWPGLAALTHPGCQVCRLWGCLRSLWSCLWSGWSAPGTLGPDVSLSMHTVDKHTSWEETIETGRKWAEIQTLIMQWCSRITRVCCKQDINIIYIYI